MPGATVRSGGYAANAGIFAVAVCPARVVARLGTAATVEKCAIRKPGFASAARYPIDITGTPLNSESYL